MDDRDANPYAPPGCEARLLRDDTDRPSVAARVGNALYVLTVVVVLLTFLGFVVGIILG